ncbi:MAG: glucose-6-phosphate isomerase, partial [Dehalococcoidales bacterium]
MEKWRDTRWTHRMTVHLDFNNMMSDFVGQGRGITREEINELAPRALEIANSISTRVEAGELGFYELPYDTETAEKIVKMAGSYRGKCDDLVILGIGGSALSTTALFRALCPPRHNLLTRRARGGQPRVFVMDNVDPASFKSVLDIINPEKTVFNVITKSGGTAETLSQFLIIRQFLEDKIGKEAAREQIVVTTGPRRERLNAMAEEEGYRLLTIPENVGGRFSVLTPVGLFPAAMFGVDILELLAGARYMDELCQTKKLLQNPAYLAGALHYLADVKRGLNIAVMMPYSDSLIQVAIWFRQLWAESLGKAVNNAGETVNVGQTPVVASGVTDQHSQMQLYQEGPYDKLITFLTVDNPPGTLAIPKMKEPREEMAYLGGHDMAELMKIELLATQLALTKAGRLNMSFILPEVNPFTIGQLFFLLEVQTVFTGGLYDINPMNQPGVEAGKQFINGMMGRSGFEDKARESRE